MPIRYTPEFFEYPKHLDLPVHKELPEGFETRGILNSFEAWSKIDRINKSAKLEFMTLCKHCGGWVPGQPHEHRVDTLEPAALAGRRGTEYYCPRCGEEIYFSGMMS